KKAAAIDLSDMRPHLPRISYRATRCVSVSDFVTRRLGRERDDDRGRVEERVDVALGLCDLSEDACAADRGADALANEARLLREVVAERGDAPGAREDERPGDVVPRADDGVGRRARRRAQQVLAARMDDADLAPLADRGRQRDAPMLA